MIILIRSQDRGYFDFGSVAVEVSSTFLPPGLCKRATYAMRIIRGTLRHSTILLICTSLSQLIFRFVCADMSDTTDAAAKQASAEKVGTVATPEDRQQTNSQATLYYVPRTIGSPIYQCLLELGLVSGPGMAPCHNDKSAQIQVKKLSFAEIKDPEYLRDVNPMGTSPAFVHENHSIEGKIQMFESGAIVSWLLEEYDTDNVLHPGPKQPGRAAYLFIQQYIIATIYPFLASLFIHTLKPEDEQDAAYVEQSKKKWTTLLGPTLQTLKVGEGAYMLGGTRPSALDFLLAKPLGNAESLGILDEFPILKKILEQIKDRPSYCEAYGTECKQHSKEEMRSFALVPCGCSSGM